MNLNFLTSSKDFDSAVASKEEYFLKDDVWIRWNGGTRPVLDHAQVFVRFRNGHETTSARTASTYAWTHGGSNYDIVAYKVVE